MALHDVLKGRILCMAISPRIKKHRPEREQPINVIGSAAQDLIEKNVSTEVCLWLLGKDNLVQLPKEPSIM